MIGNIKMTLLVNMCMHRYLVHELERLSQEECVGGERRGEGGGRGEKTRAPRGTDRSPEHNEHFCYKLDSRVKNKTTEWNKKQQHFITIASRSLVWIRFVAVAFRSEEVFWRRGPPSPCDLFGLALDPPLGQNIVMHVPGNEHFIPTKLVNIH